MKTFKEYVFLKESLFPMPKATPQDPFVARSISGHYQGEELPVIDDSLKQILKKLVSVKNRPENSGVDMWKEDTFAKRFGLNNDEINELLHAGILTKHNWTDPSTGESVPCYVIQTDDYDMAKLVAFDQKWVNKNDEWKHI